MISECGVVTPSAACDESKLDLKKTERWSRSVSPAGDKHVCRLESRNHEPKPF